MRRTSRTVVLTIAVVAGIVEAGFAQSPFEGGPDWSRDGAEGGQALGASTATAGDVDGDGFSDFLVGSPGFDAGGAVDAGRVELYFGRSGGPAQAPDWVFVGTEAGARVGFAVGAAGDFDGDGFGDVLVGVPGADGGGADAGAALLFLGSPTGLGDSPDLVLVGPAPGDAFGSAVAGAGDVNGDGLADVLVGAPGPDAGPGGGRAFLHLGTTAGVATAAAWTGASSAAGARFGTSVATGGDLDADGFSDFAVGVPGLDGVTAPDVGGVLVVLAGASLDFDEELRRGAAAGARRGESVSTAGDWDGDGYSDLVFGEAGHDGGVLLDRGRALLVYGGPAGVGLPIQLAVGATEGAAFGASVAAAGDVGGDGFPDVLVGAPGGAEVRILRSKKSSFSMTGTSVAEMVGAAVASAGDVDGDGLSDVLVGLPGANGAAGRVELHLGVRAPPLAREYEIGKHSWLGESFAVAGDVDGDGDDELAAVQRDVGEVWVFDGGAAEMALPPDWKSDPSPATKSVRVAGAGDVDGDGYADLAIGRPEPGGPGAGFVEIHRGSADGPTNPAAWTVAGIESGEEFGLALDGVGDVNADGFRDVVVGAPAHGDDHGRAVLLLGSPAGLGSTAVWEVVGQQAGMRLGAAVSGAGDVDADGFDDVLIGAPDHDGDAKETGKVRLYHGGVDGLQPDPAWVHKGGKKKMKFGFAVAGLSDVDADGFTDVAVGAPFYTKGQSTEGRVLVFLGQGGNPGDTADWKEDGNAVGHNLGHDVSDGGDVDGDGFAELIVGAPSHDSPDFSPWYDLGNKAARVTVWFGSPSGPGESLFFVGGNTYAEDFAAAVAGGGDFDGDGRADVAVGWKNAGEYDDKSSLGRIVVLDSADVAPDVASPRLRRLDDSAPVVAGGLATGGGFRARLDARNPFGAAPVAIEVEVKPVGVPFDGVATVVGPFVDVASAPVPIEAIVDGLPDGAWRWRARPRFATHLVPWAAPGVWRSPPFNGSTRPHVRTGPPFCADLAASFAYGAGKAGGAGVPVLASEPIPRLGEDVVLTVANGTSGLAPSLLVGVAAASVPFDGGTLHVAPAWVVPLPAFPADGSLAVPLSIPVDQALCGESVFFQVLFVDPAAGGALKTAQSNGLAWTIGI